ncbi:Oidioi.mRNA.OKI2018_I69.chr2.g5668.t1.cds [Oikopleura dioica]|uniref:Oidioi.mRNA.OKI2018_I69.chr2.g5668.t1.cds n=1 Tax=Oikopleura dioica TaxID=34765 RepID=A0ABN7T5C0_OIKDI|nr:Oidioi.mRNA.OKI2018_I69.chr2.g5668.t1.cds [Oikopleura dioica]
MWIWLLLVLWKASMVKAKDPTAKEVSATLDSILLDYDHRLRPDIGKKPLYVQSDVFITGFGPVDDQKREFTVDMFLRQKWKDPRLAYQSIMSKNGELKATHIKSLSLSNVMINRIWTPDAFFRNGKKSVNHNMTLPNRLLRINATGDILYTSRLTIRANCPMTVTNFPMDVHTCNLTYGSYGYTVEDVIFNWTTKSNLGGQSEPVDCPTANSRLIQFALLHHSWTEEVIDHQFGKYSVLIISFHLKRHLGYFIVQTYLPCMLIVILSQVSFWVNKEATPARMVFGVMTVLSLTTLSISERRSIPNVSYLTAMDWFIVTCFTYCFAALIEFASVNYFTVIRPRALIQQLEVNGDDSDSGLDSDGNYQPSAVNGVRRRFASSKMSNSDDSRSKITRPGSILSRFGRSSGASFWTQLANNKSIVKKLRRNRRLMRQRAMEAMTGDSHIDRVSRVMFPLTFFLFNVVYWFAYLSHRQAEIVHNTVDHRSDDHE